jgi:hypothetical protein
MIFNVKMEHFRHEAQLVAEGHMTVLPSVPTYASIVSCESIRITLTISTLNDLDILASNVQNAYITAPNSEQIWTICGIEFGIHKGRKALIVRALYSLKSTGAALRNHLASCMHIVGYKPCLADADVWLRPSIQESDDHEYYEYVLIYVNVILCVSYKPREAIDRIDKCLSMKP